MAKTLIIKGANFSTNKLDTVVLGEVPCTGISLASTASISGLEKTTTLTPTVTPANTTDAITWASSDSSIASVSGGVVTSHRPGAAAITATCGQYSDSCVVTVSVEIVAAKNGLIQVNTSGSSLVDFAALSTVISNRYISFGTTENGYPAIGSVSSGDFAGLYPYPIPEGAKTIKVKKQGLAPLIVYYNSQAKSVAEVQTRVRDCAKVLDGETSAGGTQWSISGWEYGERTFTIPDTEGIDSFTVGFYTNSASDYSNFDTTNPGIEITFGYE